MEHWLDCIYRRTGDVVGPDTCIALSLAWKDCGLLRMEKRVTFGGFLNPFFVLTCGLIMTSSHLIHPEQIILQLGRRKRSNKERVNVLEVQVHVAQLCDLCYI